MEERAPGTDGPRTARRRVLRGLAGAGLLALAGCSGGGDGGGTTAAEPSETATRAETGTETPTATATGTAPPTTESRPTTRPPTDTPTRTVDTASLEAEVGELSMAGSLFDMHSHYQPGYFDGSAPRSFTDAMAANDVGGALIFVTPDYVERNYARVLQHLSTSTVEYVPFLVPDVRESADSIISQYETYSEVFYGIGETVFYSGPLKGKPVDTAPLPGLYRYANDNGIPMMLHFDLAQVNGGVESLLGNYPDIPFLFHGPGPFRREHGFGRISTLLEQYPNMHWTSDVSVHLSGLAQRTTSASAFSSRYESEADQSFETVRRALPDMLEAAPERVMWGTDVGSATWETGASVYGKYMQWTDRVLAELTSEQQAAYSHENARRFASRHF